MTADTPPPDPCSSAMIDDSPEARLVSEYDNASTPMSEFDIEDTAPTPPYTVVYGDTTVHITTTDWRRSPRLCLQLALVFSWFVVIGINDQLVGTLIPKLKEHYLVSDAGVLLIFFGQMLGYCCVGVGVEPIHRAVGLGGVITGLAMSILVGLTIGCTAPPRFLFLALGYVFVGAGVGGLDAAGNAWLAQLENAHALLGMLHAAYGLGGFLAPNYSLWLLLRGWEWYQLYWVPCSVLAVTLPWAVYAFYLETAAKYRYEHEQATANTESPGTSSTLTDLRVWLLTGVIAFYVGAEMGFAEWLPSYLMRAKDRDFHSAARLTLLYWLGLTCGRLVLGFVTSRLPLEYFANLAYLGLTTASVAVVSTTSGTHPRVVGAVNFVVGWWIGPIFPTTMAAALKLLPPHIRVSGIGVAAGLGAAGSSLFPWLIGIVNTHVQTMWNLPWCVVALLGATTVCWVVLRWRS